MAERRFTVESFAQAAVDADLFAPAAAADLLAGAPAEARASAAAWAKWLCKEGALTKFQTRLLVEGSPLPIVHDGYELLDKLGKGGMGDVYLAWSRRQQRHAAIKMPQAAGADAKKVRRFQREIEVHRRLEHPRVALAYEAGLWGESPFLAMEYVHGPTLFQYVRRHGPLHPFWAAQWLADIADALDYVHQGGVVHRDLKPGNLIATPERVAKLLDLGLARWYEDDPNEIAILGSRKAIGTADYMPPEQALDSAHAEPRSDLYALGCVLWFALVGKPPFADSADRREKLRRHREERLPPLRKVRKDVPADLEAIAAVLLRKDPADRFSVAAQARDELLRCADRILQDRLPPPLPDHWMPPLPEAPRRPMPRDAGADGGFWRRVGGGLTGLFGRKDGKPQ